MRNLIIILLSACCLILSIGHMIQEYDIANMKQTLKRIENGYNAVLAENRKLERMNEQNLRLLAEGGWEWAQ